MLQYLNKVSRRSGPMNTVTVRLVNDSTLFGSLVHSMADEAGFAMKLSTGEQIGVSWTAVKYVEVPAQ